MPEKVDFQVLATTLMGAVNESLEGFLKTKADKQPTVDTQPLYALDKWNICTYGEFVDGCYMSVIYFYRNASDKESHRFCGMMVLYINTSSIKHLVNVFGYKNAEEAGEEMTADAVAELCNNIAGVFKKDLRSVGYPELEISTPLKFKGFAAELDYPKGQRNFYRVKAFVWGTQIIMDVILTV